MRETSKGHNGNARHILRLLCEIGQGRTHSTIANPHNILGSTLWGPFRQPHALLRREKEQKPQTRTVMWSFVSKPRAKSGWNCRAALGFFSNLYASFTLARPGMIFVVPFTYT
jgi:hypothetical protein